MAKLISCSVLTEENFKPYGTVIRRPQREGDVERDYLSWWGGLYDLDFNDTASMGILSIKRRPFIVDQLERHMKAVEIFVPLRGVSIMPFADPKDITKCETFIIDGSVSIIIDKGVWHFPPFPVTEEMEFMLTVRKETADDLEIRDVPGMYIQL